MQDSSQDPQLKTDFFLFETFKCQPEKEDPRVEKIWEKLDFCSCGEPNRVVELISGYLKLLKARKADWDSRDAHLTRLERMKINLEAERDVYDRHLERIRAWGGEDLYLVISYIADALGLTEHGGSVGGAWLLQEGEDWLALDKEEEDERNHEKSHP